MEGIGPKSTKIWKAGRYKTIYGQMIGDRSAGGPLEAEAIPTLSVS